MSPAADVPELRIDSAVAVRPATGDETGGDFHLVRRVGDRTLALVGDVEGHGAEATPYAERALAMLEGAVEDADDPGAVLERLNRAVRRATDFDRLVTACAVVIDHVGHTASWAFAGHLPPHWLDTGLPIDGATPGQMLGVAESCNATSASRDPIHPGEGMVLFTDGLEDVQGPGGDRFGTARVTHVLSTRYRGASAAEIAAGLEDAALEFGGGTLGDDLCVLVVRVLV